MAAPSVHDKTGKHCAHCGKQFVKSSLNLTVSNKIEGFIIKECVCGDCFHKHHSKGE